MTARSETDLLRGDSKVIVHALQIIEADPLPPSRQHIRQSGQYTARATTVHERISAVEIADRFLKPMRLGFKNKPLVSGTHSARPIDRQTELERHIETRREGRMPIELDA